MFPLAYKYFYTFQENKEKQKYNEKIDLFTRYKHQGHVREWEYKVKLLKTLPISRYSENKGK